MSLWGSIFTFDSCSVTDGYGFLARSPEGVGKERAESEVANAKKTFLKELDALLEPL